jgi:predicted phosphodiesterase
VSASRALLLLIMAKVFCISDAHFPFHNKTAYKHMLTELKAAKPTHVVQIGDLLDQYIHSNYAKSATIGADEFDQGRALAVEMWKTIRKLAPKAKCYQVLGNHDVRLAKRSEERLPAAGDAVKLYLKGMYSFKGVATLESDRGFVEIDGVIYTHGWLSKSVDHAKHFNKPTVHGHRHRPAIEVDRPGLWSMDVGFMADENSLPLSNTQSKVTKWTLACGVVENKQPRLIFLKDGNE